ncbi:MAG: hypothetical protein K2X81_07165, partial [Candidatus Obscuribacterales bacterium]|nr:hypothetical protein [Candidatus Obscuribacterales bacterium]
AVLQRAVATCQARFLDVDERAKAIQQSREILFEAICAVANETQREECAHSMAQFEQRLIEHYPIRAEGELHASYRHLSRLLNQSANERSLPWQTRLMAASHFLTHAARPETISQGSKIGAQVICLLQKIMTIRPSRLADMLASATYEGSWQAFDGKDVLLDEHTMKPGPEEILYKPGDNRRSYAIKILQCILLNNCLLRRSTPMTYAENPGRPGRDYSGQIIQTLEGRPINPKFGANLGYFEVALLAHYEFGEKRCVIVNDSAFDTNSPEVFDASRKNFLIHINSLDDLTEALNNAKDDDNIPVMIAVDERRLLAEQYDDGVNHIINVVVYNEYGILKIYNPQLLPGTPRVARITLPKLYNATLGKTKI